MKKRKGLLAKILIGMLMCTPLQKVQAECEYKVQNELKSQAANVDAKYEIKEVVTDYNGVEHPEISEEIANTLESGYVMMDIVVINLLNVTENIYLTFENQEENVFETIRQEDLVDGKYIYRVPDTNTIREYTIKVYSNNGDCMDEELRTITLKTPKYNEFANWEACENSTKYYCQKYVTSDAEITEEMIYKDYTPVLEENKEETKKENYIWKIGLGVGIIGLAIGALVLYRKKHSTN